MIMLDGVVARPMPERRIEKAMTKRGKLVTMIRMPGATDEHRQKTEGPDDPR